MAIKIASILVTGDSRLRVEALAAALSPPHVVITSMTVAMRSETPVDIVVCDARGYEGCVASLRVCRPLLPETPVVAIGGPFDETQHLQLIERGVVACVPAHAPVGELLDAVDAGLRCEASCSSRIASVAFARLAHLGKIKQLDETAQLTYREFEVFQLVQQGLSNKEIATLLAISVSTAKNHVHQVLAKLQIKSRWHAIDWEARLVNAADFGGPQSEVTWAAGAGFRISRKGANDCTALTTIALTKRRSA